MDVASTAAGTVVFYNYALAFNPAKARLALEEKGIKVRNFWIWQSFAAL